MMLSLLLSVSLSCFLLGFSLTSASDVLLPQPPAAVSEGDSLSLTCTYTGSDTLSFIAWYLVVGTVGGGDDDNKGNIVYSTCSGTIDASLYSYTCGTNSVIWTIKSLQQSEDGQQWYCKVVTSTATIDSSTITVEIAETTTTTTTTTPALTTSNAPDATDDLTATNPTAASSTSGTTTSSLVGDNSNLTAHIIIPAVLGGVFLLIAVTIGIGLCYRYNARIKQDKNTTGMAMEHGSPQHHRSSRPHGSPERHRSHKPHSQHTHTTGHRQDRYLHQGQPIHPQAMGSGYEPHRESDTHYIPYDNPAYTDRM